MGNIFTHSSRIFLELRERGVCIIDVGANCGDTTAAILSQSPDTRVIAIEGSTYFLKYLRKNFQTHQQVWIVDRFVTYKEGSWELVSDRSTGHLIEAEIKNFPSEQLKTVTPAEILDLVDKEDLCIWKSDTDGYDIPILLGSFNEITTACEVLWIEFDPIGNLSEPADVDRIIAKLTTLTREVVIFDNFGHRMSRFPCKEAASRLRDIVTWLNIQNSEGTRVVIYVDIWVLPSDMADLLCSKS